ncbi:MAG TPA: flagellar filament capping protein FliD [Clostridia bacterium]|nr:flagellar filament capping protein FliD [Clostridia bacterium]
MNGLSGFSSQMRLTGLSGFDTESTIEQLMKAERVPLDKLMQKRTLLEWKQESYREVSSSLIGFKSKFFDVVNQSSYLLSENSINTKAAKSSNSDYVSAKGLANASSGSQSIKVLNLASAAKSESAGAEGVSKPITGVVNGLDIAWKKMTVNLDGVVKDITVENYSSENELVTKLQQALDKAFGSSKLKITHNETNHTLSLDTINGATKVTVSDPLKGNSALPGLGFVSGESNRLSLNSTLGSLNNSLNVPIDFNEGGLVSFKINGKTFTADVTDTLQSVFDEINKDADAKVNISYDEITDKITLSAKQTGTGSTLVLEETDTNFIAALGLGNITSGQDAKVLLNGTQTLVRSTNNFTVNGISYTLNKVHEETSAGETITITQDTDSVIKNVKTFIEEYNKLIDSINTKTHEKYDRDYQPLTDEQKEDMSESDIEKWEKKAKTGILKNDSILDQITYSMRKALFDKVEGSGINLKDIGIESKSYTDNGKLYLDENKLKNALLNKPEEVSKLLNGVSSDYPVYSRDQTTEARKIRYDQSGLLQRLSDIIEDNTSTIRNEKGDKGILLVKAGIENDLSNIKNLMTDELYDYDERVDELIDKLTKKEENYYTKFANLETMLNRMNQQSAWLTSQLGGGSQ